MNTRRGLIQVALGSAAADTVIMDGRIVNTHTGQVYAGGVAIKGDRIAAIGDVEYTIGADTDQIDAQGRYITPGLVDAHWHSYHSYLGVNEFVEATVRHGVTTWADGFYGQGVVGGADAVRFFKDAFADMPIRLLFLVPCIAHVQNRELGLTPAAGVSHEEMMEMIEWEDCYGLEEPPPLPILWEWDQYLDLFERTLALGKTISGHAASLTEREVQAYVSMGASTDHETVDVADGVAKARAGMRVLMRHGSGAHDVKTLSRLYTEESIDPQALGLCADLASPEKLVREGATDENIRVAIHNGIPPITAVQMATKAGADVFGLGLDIGSVAPGRYADILLVDDLPSFSIDSVYFEGKRVVEGGRFVAELPPTVYPSAFYDTVRLAREIIPEDLEVRVHEQSGTAEVRVIGVTDGSLGTTELRANLPVHDQVVQGSLPDDILPIAMVDRLGKGTGIGLGFVKGFGLERGAIASSVNAVCENIVAVGATVEDMALAVNRVAEMGGGKVVVADGRELAAVELPLLGLLSEDPLERVTEKFAAAFTAIAKLGCPLSSAFSTLEFCCACGEIGDIKLSEEGLVLFPPPERVELVLAVR